MKKDMIGGKLSGRQVIAACAALVLVCKMCIRDRDIH